MKCFFYKCLNYSVRIINQNSKGQQEGINKGRKKPYQILPRSDFGVLNAI